jgi:predicted Zn-dependent peptidase
MYRDNPDWRVYFGLIEALYQKHPVHIDIAGTAESVRSITKELLYECYRTFYHPSNMTLFVVGGIDPEAVMELVRSNQAAKKFGPGGKIERLFDEEPAEVRLKEQAVQLPVSLPKCLFGFKDEPVKVPGDEAIKRDLTTKLMLEALLGSSSVLYQQLYNDNLISDNFTHEYNLGPGYAFSVIGGETRDPEELLQRVCDYLYRTAEQGMDAQVFERTRKKRIGSLLRMLNSPEAIASEFMSYRLKGGDLFRAVEMMESLTLADAEARLREHVSADRLAVSIVRSSQP